MDSNNWRVKRDPSDASTKHETLTPPSRQRRTKEEKNGAYGQRQPGKAPNQHGQSRDMMRKPLNDAKAEQAMEEGRRVYVGNMPYEATMKDIESLFKDIADGVQAINLSVDPVTGRNPSYCFVDFKTKDLADRVMEEYNGRNFLTRPLKVKPGIKSGTSNASRPLHQTNRSNDPPVFDRWRRLETPEQLNNAGQEGRRLYVGGLPRFENQEDSNAQIKDLFRGFNVEVISKVISAHESKKDEPGNHNYCFVDLATVGEAEAAMATLNGIEKWGWKLKVNQAFGTSGKLSERRRLYVGGLPEFEGHEALEAGIQELFEGFEVKLVSKMFWPREKKDEEATHCFCFVELPNEEQTDAAILALDYKEMWGWKVRVKHAFGNSKQTERPEARGWGPSKIR